VVQPLVVRLEHGEHPVHQPPSRRQLSLFDHLWEVPDLFEKPVEKHRPKGNAEPSHDYANGPRELGEVLDVHHAGLLRLAPGVPGLLHLDRGMLSRHLGLLKFGSGF
jgi:hypothetical protein